MLHPSTKRLIDKLSEMTRKQRVAWSEGENGTITHDTEGYRVVLTPEPHAVLLTDALGKEIESCTPDEFADETDASGRPYASFVSDLYREAHRHARGAEKAIHTVLKGLETIEAAPEPEIVLDPADLIEDLGDDTDSLPEAYPEVEGQNDMARAVASMADELNGGAKQDEADAEASPESDMEPDLAISQEAGDEMEPDAEPVADPVFLSVHDDADMAESSSPVSPELDEIEPDESAETATETDDAAHMDFSAFTPEPDTEPETPLWPADENAPEPESGLDEAKPEAETEPEPSPPASSMFGTSHFGSGAGGLSRYMSPPPPESPVSSETDAETESGSAPAPLEVDAAAADVPTPYTPAFSNDDPVIEDVEPEPTPEETAADEPAQPRSFSLSGLSSGFGLGSAGRTGSIEPDNTAPVSTNAAPERTRMVIDGTADLPDDMPVSEFDTATEIPAESDTASEPFHFREPASPAESIPQSVPDEPESSTPEEQAFEAPAERVETQHDEEPAEESPPPAPKVTTRFNPWN